MITDEHINKLKQLDEYLKLPRIVIYADKSGSIRHSVDDIRLSTFKNEEELTNQLDRLVKKYSKRIITITFKTNNNIDVKDITDIVKEHIDKDAIIHVKQS